MRRRQSRRLQNQAKRARIQRMAEYLRDIDARNATEPRRSLRLIIQRTVAPYPVILFGEDDFWPDDPAEIRLLPPEGFRIVCNDDWGETDDDDTSTLTTEYDLDPSDASSTAASVNYHTSTSGTDNTTEDDFDPIDLSSSAASINSHTSSSGTDSASESASAQHLISDESS